MAKKLSPKKKKNLREVSLCLTFHITLRKTSPAAISVWTHGEPQGYATETRQVSHGSDIWVVSGHEIHQTCTHRSPVLERVAEVVQAHDRITTRASSGWFRRAIGYEACASRNEGCNSGAIYGCHG
ncbi:hypothetical protein AMTRI_Chr09g22780 [Amborella trichopoda]